MLSMVWLFYVVIGFRPLSPIVNSEDTRAYNQWTIVFIVLYVLSFFPAFLSAANSVIIRDV